MTADLLPCPFCGGSAERIDFGPGSGDNEGGSCIECTKCQSSGPVEFGYKENFVSNWNRRALSHAVGQEAVGGQWELVPCGFLIDGPNGTAMVLDRAFIEPKIAALCENNGDDPEDYTATELHMKAWRGRAVDTPAQPPASAEVGRDAARYRWWRENCAFSSWQGDVKVHHDLDMSLGADIDGCRSNMDAAIDAAMAASSGRKGGES